MVCPSSPPLHPSLVPPGFPPPYTAPADLALLHEQLRAEEIRRLGEMEVIKEAQLRKGEANTVVGLSSPESVTVPSAAHGSSHGASIPHTAVLTPSHNPSPAHSRPSTSNEAL